MISGAVKRNSLLKSYREERRLLRIQKELQAREIFQIFGNNEGMSILTDRFAAKEVCSLEDADKFFKVIQVAYLSVYKSSDLKKSKTYDEFLETIKKDFMLYENNSSSIVVYDRIHNVPVATMRLVYKGQLPIEKQLVPKIQLTSLKKRGIRTAEAGRFALVCSGMAKGKAFMLLGRMMISILMREAVDILFIASVNPSISLIPRLGLKEIGKGFFWDQLSVNVSVGWGQTLHMMDIYSQLSGSHYPVHQKIQLFLFSKKIKLRRFFSSVNFRNIEKVILDE